MVICPKNHAHKSKFRKEVKLITLKSNNKAIAKINANHNAGKIRRHLFLICCKIYYDFGQLSEVRLNETIYNIAEERLDRSRSQEDIKNQPTRI